MTAINAVAEIKALRITTGPLANGYVIAPAGKLNWYFTNLGLLPILQYLNSQERQDYVRNYLDLYISRLESNFTIMDVNFTGGDVTQPVKVTQDSDDSYAATTLSLAARYMALSNDNVWYAANIATLKNMAYYNLATQVKANGLTSVFQRPNANEIGYLMDNCEVYRGLRDFQALLASKGDSDAAYYGTFATTIGNAIKTLWDAVRGGYRAGDAYVAADTTFYPGTFCQSFPQAFGVVEAKSTFTGAWNYFNLYSPNWTALAYDPFPWAIHGYVARLRGNTARARTQLANIDKLFVSNRAMVTINELGWYQRARSLTNGMPAI